MKPAISRNKWNLNRVPCPFALTDLQELGVMTNSKRDNRIKEYWRQEGLLHQVLEKQCEQRGGSARSLSKEVSYRTGFSGGIEIDDAFDISRVAEHFYGLRILLCARAPSV